jgi:hypothetical protein
MNVLDMTAMAISHGLMSRCSPLPIRAIAYTGLTFPKMISECNGFVISIQNVACVTESRSALP